MLRSFVCQYRATDGQLREYAVPADTIEQAMADAETTLDDPDSIVAIYEDPDEFDFLLKEVLPDTHDVCVVCGTPYAAAADVGCGA